MLEYYRDFSHLRNDFFDDFKQEMGMRKLESIKNRVENSKSINSLFISALKEDFFPNGKTLSVAILNSRHFMFARNEVLICAGLLALSKYYDFRAEKNFSIDEDQFLHSAKSLIHHCRKI